MAMPDTSLPRSARDSTNNKPVSERIRLDSGNYRPPEYIFEISEQASKEACIETLQEQLIRLEALLTLMQKDNRDPYFANGFSLTERQAESVFDECISVVRFSQTLTRQVVKSEE